MEKGALLPRSLERSLLQIERAFQPLPEPGSFSWGYEIGSTESDKLNTYFGRVARGDISVNDMHSASVAHELAFLSVPALQYLMPRLLRLAAEEMVHGRMGHTFTQSVSALCDPRFSGFRERFANLSSEQLSRLSDVIKELAELESTLEPPRSGWKESVDWFWGGAANRGLKGRAPAQTGK